MLNINKSALKQLKERIPSIRKQNPLIPQSIENIILKSTAKNPKNREIVMISGLFIVNPPNTNPKPVIKPTAKFPIKGVDFNLYAYK